MRHCRILVLHSGFELVPPALGVQSLHHWTTGQILVKFSSSKNSYLSPIVFILEQRFFENEM